MPVTVKYANAYLTDRAYGGPEEGGWWYDVGEPVMSLPFTCNDETVESGDIGATITTYDNLSRSLATEQVYDLCVAAGVDVPEKNYLESRDWNMDGFMIAIEDHPGEFFPQKRPHWDMGEDY